MTKQGKEGASNKGKLTDKEQLRVVNQQLKASEQQLKAANQQLRASEQQLKAANQQLEAGNRQLKAAEEELGRSRRRYKTMFEGTVNAIVVYEAIDEGNDFVVKNLNPAAEQIEDVKKAELLGKKVVEVLPQVGQFGLFDVVKRVYKSGRAEHYSEVMHKERRIFAWREDYVFKLPSDEIVVVYEDITKRRRAEEARKEEHNLLRTLIDNIPDLVYIKDTKSRFVIANKGVAYFMGAAVPDELIGRTDFEFYPNALATQFYDVEQEVISSGRPLVNREERIKGKSGEVKWILTTKVPWCDSQGNVVGIVGIGRDITERKGAEEALKAANQQLEATNQQLRASEQQLEATNQQLRASEQQLKAANQQLQASEQQLQAANQQLRASEQQLRAANQQLRANEEELRRVNYMLHKHLKELGCLYGLSRLDKDRHISLEKICRGLLELIPPAWQYPEITAVRIIIKEQCFQTENFRQTEWRQSTDIGVHGKKAGSIEVYYLEERPGIDDGPFLVEEKDLLDVLAEHLGDIAERKDAEEKLLDYQSQLKSLASELSLTEEREKRRIATELHDRIGQFLIMSKVQLEALRESTSSKEIVGVLSDVCNSLDQTIHNTRLLTFDLSSPILYELGFEAAVAEWLVEQIEHKHGIKTELRDDGEPKPLDDDIRALLFRDVRELLINVIKHAGAEKVKVSIRKAENKIRICVEDDGVGFAVSELGSIASKTGGFGLFSVRERLEQLGGHLEVKSEPGRGTQVTITAPLKQSKD